jgi:hypothetical protein
MEPALLRVVVDPLDYRLVGIIDEYDRREVAGGIKTPLGTCCPNGV